MSTGREEGRHEGVKLTSEGGGEEGSGMKGSGGGVQPRHLSSCSALICLSPPSLTTHHGVHTTTDAFPPRGGHHFPTGAGYITARGGSHAHSFTAHTHGVVYTRTGTQAHAHVYTPPLRKTDFGGRGHVCILYTHPHVHITAPTPNHPHPSLPGS